MSVDLAQFYKSQAQPRSTHEGQLTQEFQAALAARYARVDEASCLFTHVVALPGGRVVNGGWDLRGSESDIVDHVPLRGKRVLEYGPCSGFLTSYLTQQADQVVALETAPGLEHQATPTFAPLSDEFTAEMRETVERMRRSWWFTKRETGFRADIVYADVHAPPADLGLFDISVMAATLLRVPNPYLLLQNAAAITKEAIVVTEPLSAVSRPEDPESPIALFAPMNPETPNHWWHHTPAVVIRMLATVGFGDFNVSIHTPASQGIQLPLFTVSAKRLAALQAAA